MYREVLDELAVNPGKASSDYGRVLNNLGQVLAAAGRTPDALVAYREAEAVLTGALGSESAEVATVRGNIAAAGG